MSSLERHLAPGTFTNDGIIYTVDCLKTLQLKHAISNDLDLLVHSVLVADGWIVSVVVAVRVCLGAR